MNITVDNKLLQFTIPIDYLTNLHYDRCFIYYTIIKIKFKINIDNVSCKINQVSCMYDKRLYTSGIIENVKMESFYMREGIKEHGLDIQIKQI